MVEAAGCGRSVATADTVAQRYEKGKPRRCKAGRGFLFTVAAVPSGVAVAVPAALPLS